MEQPRVFLDTDIVINWLIQETESKSNKELWRAPYEIIHLIEEERIFGAISLTTLLEIRFLLRRKKNYSLKQVEGDIGVFTSLLDVIIPDEINLIKANSLQADLPLDPFDAIHLAISIGLSPVTLLTRDKDFIKIARRFLTAMTPEDFLVTLKRS